MTYKIKALVVVAMLLIAAPCLAFDPSKIAEKYSALKAAGRIKSIEVNAGYVGPEVRYLVKIRQYDPDTSVETENPKEIYFIVEKLQAAKVVLQTPVDNTAHIASIDALIEDLEAVE